MANFVEAWIVAQASGDGAVWFGANDIDDEGRWVWGAGCRGVREQTP